MFSIVPYESKHAICFKELNLAWIKEHFQVEAMDIELLENCESSILNKGGFIFIGLWDNKPVGCFSLQKHAEGHFELGKMAVNTSHQGLHIGQKMLAFAIDFGKNKNWRKIDLYSSTKLNTALHIYEKFGFKKVPLEDTITYLRSDIKMELTL
ncbi:GNAT family N-acetyltransferase [Maribacter sp. ACAM166]|uniref:GNAT family N-acetyltransferase n=1 Tax=Maribacter sp. ACAM166 TaxID=2508996 RepID=UPI0010FEDA94|nr:GNAT family N-acetyltransferase [Maribacter sp. ACAM166]TLP77607.1 GNAT family N-acetyltransferase [Maribacter sp. ACAM166]